MQGGVELYGWHEGAQVREMRPEVPYQGKDTGVVASPVGRFLPVMGVYRSEPCFLRFSADILAAFGGLGWRAPSAARARMNGAAHWRRLISSREAGLGRLFC